MVIFPCQCGFSIYYKVERGICLEGMKNEEIQRFSEQDETKALILAIVFGAFGLFIFLGV